MKINNIINKNEILKQQKQLLKSIPGVGEVTALYFLLATKGFSAFKTWRKFACYSGIAPFEYSSGSSIRGKTKVSHLADKKNEIFTPYGNYFCLKMRCRAQRILLEKKI